MDYTSIAITAAITALVGGVVGAILTTMIGMAKKARQSAEDDSNEKDQLIEALSEGIKALLWRELKNIHTDAVNNGGMTIEERKHLENVYHAYHDGVHGNGTGTRLFEEAMDTDILD